MRKFLVLVITTAALSFLSSNTYSQFIDLTTGEKVTIIKHQATGMMHNTVTQRPVYIYIDPATSDTFYGRTGEKINGSVTKDANGKYQYSGDQAYIFHNGFFRLRQESDAPGYKIKMENDGDVKVKKDGDYKRKVDENGDLKLKQNGEKVKLGADGQLKVKDSAYKKKIDEDGNYLEKTDSVKVKMKVDGSSKLKDKRTDYKGKQDENGDIKEKEAGEKRKFKAGNKTKVKNAEVKVKVTPEQTKVKPKQ